MHSGREKNSRSALERLISSLRPSKGLVLNYEVNEKFICFCCLSVNYNNLSPAVGNDSQNGINCCWWATKVYKLTNNIVMNNNIARLYFQWTITWSFSYIYAWHKIDDRKNGPALRAILMAMRIRRYGAECIAQYSRSRATRDAT